MNIEQRIIANGVTWHPCDGCGRPWPFPSGPDHDAPTVFQCGVCCHALLSALTRRTKECDAWPLALRRLFVLFREAFGDNDRSEMVDLLTVAESLGAVAPP